MSNRTIYDHRTAVQEAAERAGPRLYVALKNLLEAVEERQHVRDGIESVVISDAHNALVAACAPTPKEQK